MFYGHVDLHTRDTMMYVEYLFIRVHSYRTHMYIFNNYTAKANNTYTLNIVCA